ncbi:hypothetical protein WDU94_015542 [Cyamophila willieti]
MGHPVTFERPPSPLPPGLDDPALILEEEEIRELEASSEHGYAVTPSQPTKRKHKVDVLAQLMEFEKEKVNELKRRRSREEAEEGQKDDAYHFLMSLLPKLRALPSDRQFSVRMAIMEALEDKNN